MPDLDLGPEDYRTVGSEPVRKPRLSFTEFLSFWIASRWATQKRDEDFESRQLTAIVYGVGLFLMRKWRG